MADGRAASEAKIRILVLNPNSSASMTEGMSDAIDSITISSSTDIDTYVAPPSSPESINNDSDLVASTQTVLEDLQGTDLLSQYDGILVACFSDHPLVGMLGKNGNAPFVVTGILQSSILTSLLLLPPAISPSVGHCKWGIITTGSFWPAHLSKAVSKFLGTGRSAQSSVTNNRFAGIQCTNLLASDFHGSNAVAKETVISRLREATVRLLQNDDVGVVVMGCAGMAGFEGIIRGVAVDMYGAERGNYIVVVDSVKAGIGVVEQMVQNRRMFCNHFTGSSAQGARSIE